MSWLGLPFHLSCFLHKKIKNPTTAFLQKVIHSHAGSNSEAEPARFPVTYKTLLLTVVFSNTFCWCFLSWTCQKAIEVQASLGLPHAQTCAWRQRESELCQVCFWPVLLNRSSRDGQIEQMTAYHQYVPTFALSSGLRMWIKLIMSENIFEKEKGQPLTEFKVEVRGTRQEQPVPPHPIRTPVLQFIEVQASSKKGSLTLRAKQI